MRGGDVGRVDEDQAESGAQVVDDDAALQLEHLRVDTAAVEADDAREREGGEVLGAFSDGHGGQGWRR